MRSQNFKRSNIAVKATGWAPVQVYWCVCAARLGKSNCAEKEARKYDDVSVINLVNETNIMSRKNPLIKATTPESRFQQLILT